MKNVVTTERIPIKSWVSDLEEGALEQTKNLANLPFSFKHVALMPDAHLGYGMPIGGVLATQGVVIPNAVDIGCGMCVIRTSLNDIDGDTLKKIMGLIRKRVPVGFKHHRTPQDESSMATTKKDMYVVNIEYEAALLQLGTLGGGNHFIEIQKGSDGRIWIMIHTGSRNIGYTVAKYYNDIAKNINEKWYSKVTKEMELAFLPLETQEAKYYMNEMQYCVDFAFANRRVMMEKIKNVFYEILDSELAFGNLINIAHNYAAMEHHFGHNVLVHRKGATSAREGEIGIIPGSQGTKSYIVKGLGNAESFNSCSHGAGRKMGRKQAIRELNLEDEIKKLNDLGVIHGIRNEKDLDEAAGAYKDIDIVMENQKDLVEIVVELTPMAVIKG